MRGREQWVNEHYSGGRELAPASGIGGLRFYVCRKCYAAVIDDPFSGVEDVFLEHYEWHLRISSGFAYEGSEQPNVD